MKREQCSSLFGRLLYYIPVLLISLIVFLIPLRNGDELWNYNFAVCIVKGMLPYRDFNIIQTPLAPYIGSLFLMAFGENLFAYRIAGASLAAAVGCLVQWLSTEILSQPLLALIAAVFLMLIQIAAFQFNYNYLVLALVLLSLLLERRYIDRKGPLRSAMLGVLFGLMPLAKQNTGAALFAVNVLICILDVRYWGGARRESLIRCFSSLLPPAFFLLWLHFSGLWKPFYTYAVRGLRTFTQRITFIDFFITSPVGVFFALLAAAVYVVALAGILRGNRSRCVITHLLISLAEMTIVFPLFDAVHLFCGLCACVPLSFYFIRAGRSAKALRRCVAVAALVAVISVSSFLLDVKGTALSKLKHYEGIPINPDLETQIQTVDDYMSRQRAKNKEVYLACEYAAAYTIPLNLYRKDWDMLLTGNLGAATAEELLNVSGESLFLLYKDSDMQGYQAYRELDDYIRNNYLRIDEVMCFDVYQRKME